MDKIKLKIAIILLNGIFPMIEMFVISHLPKLVPPPFHYHGIAILIGWLVKITATFWDIFVVSFYMLNAKDCLYCILYILFTKLIANPCARQDKLTQFSIMTKLLHRFCLIVKKKIKSCWYIELIFSRFTPSRGLNLAYVEHLRDVSHTE